MNHGDISHSLRWTTASRYYRAAVQQDLFGQWEVVRCWGGLGSRLGGFSVQPTNSREAALIALDREASRRERRGYRQCRDHVVITSSGLLRGRPAEEAQQRAALCTSASVRSETPWGS